MQALSDAISGTLEKFGIDPGSVILNLGSKTGQSNAAAQPSSQIPAARPAAASPDTRVGFNALVPSTIPASFGSALAPVSMPAQHFYASDPVDDLYWNSQPPAVQQLREIDDMDKREALGAKLASQGFQIDVPVMVWGWDAGKTTDLRKSFGYTWIPSALQQPVSAAPGLQAPGMNPYDPKNPPSGSIQV